MSNSSPFFPNNDDVLNIYQIIKVVMSSAVEAEFIALLINTREAVYIQKILEEIGHKQDQTPMQVYDITAVVVINKKSNQNAPRAWI